MITTSSRKRTYDLPTAPFSAAIFLLLVRFLPSLESGSGAQVIAAH
jgi:hypothetical protein